MKFFDRARRYRPSNINYDDSAKLHSSVLTYLSDVLAHPDRYGIDKSGPYMPEALETIIGDNTYQKIAELDMTRDGVLIVGDIKRILNEANEAIKTAKMDITVAKVVSQDLKKMVKNIEKKTQKKPQYSDEARRKAELQEKPPEPEADVRRATREETDEGLSEGEFSEVEEEEELEEALPGPESVVGDDELVAGESDKAESERDISGEEEGLIQEEVVEEEKSLEEVVSERFTGQDKQVKTKQQPELLLDFRLLDEKIYNQKKELGKDFKKLRQYVSSLARDDSVKTEQDFIKTIKDDITQGNYKNPNLMMQQLVIGRGFRVSSSKQHQSPHIRELLERNRIIKNSQAIEKNITTVEKTIKSEFIALRQHAFLSIHEGSVDTEDEFIQGLKDHITESDNTNLFIPSILKVPVSEVEHSISERSSVSTPNILE